MLLKIGRYSEVMENSNQHSLSVDSANAKKRLDAFLAAEVAKISRSQWKTLIEKGLVQLNGATCKPNAKLKSGDEICWTIPKPMKSCPL